MSQTKAQLVSNIVGNVSGGANFTGIVTAAGGFSGNITGTASTASFATTSFGLSGTPNLNVGVVTASSFVGNVTGNATGLSGTPNLNVGVVTATTLRVGTAVTINAGIVTASSFVGNLDNSVIGNYTEKISNLGNTGVGATVNLNNGNVFTATLTGNCTFTFNTGITTGAASFTLILANDGTAGRSIVWPASVKWPNNVTPSRTTTANATDIWSFFTPNNGTTWYGNIALYNFT